jgi:hypothetical protein
VPCAPRDRDLAQSRNPQTKKKGVAKVAPQKFVIDYSGPANDKIVSPFRRPRKRDLGVPPFFPFRPQPG